LADIRDSCFNLIDDKLKNIIYEGNTTLGDILSQSALVPPLWGATLWFDVNGENTDGNNEGIVQSTEVMPGTPSSKTQLTIKFTQPIAGKKLLVSVFTDNSNPHMHSNICTPVIKAGYN